MVSMTAAQFWTSTSSSRDPGNVHGLCAVRWKAQTLDDGGDRRVGVALAVASRSGGGDGGRASVEVPKALTGREGGVRGLVLEDLAQWDRGWW